MVVKPTIEIVFETVVTLTVLVTKASVELSQRTRVPVWPESVKLVGAVVPEHTVAAPDAVPATVVGLTVMQTFGVLAELQTPLLTTAR